MLAQDLKDYVIEPVLAHLDSEIPHTVNAVYLLLATAAHESKFNWLDQTPPGPGPAYGFWQMEAVTYDDHWRWLIQHPRLVDLVKEFELRIQGAKEMTGNLYLGAAMCRIHYWRKPGNIPSHLDAEGMAKYWKKFYNTHLGKGKEEDFVKTYKALISGII